MATELRAPTQEEAAMTGRQRRARRPEVAAWSPDAARVALRACIVPHPSWRIYLRAILSPSLEAKDDACMSKARFDAWCLARLGTLVAVGEVVEVAP